jgi:hypothetical protein
VRQIASGEQSPARLLPVGVHDRLRDRSIEQIMCDYRVDLARQCAEFDVNPAPLAASPRPQQLIADGMVR